MFMEDYKFFSMNGKPYTTVLSFGSHICNRAARIRVKFDRNVKITDWWNAMSWAVKTGEARLPGQGNRKVRVRVKTSRSGEAMRT
jgi:hypothetical protein